ncbi:O-acyltransferase like protein-like [Ostrinia furnacalis]|uniref:O-acyltransferase like protein-like n=1 Tax=Ostrinia furnacalis TaxID=93504 RepID=UPI00103DA872|nr:O-acyltransferase like protein-like [Ostrinia furnacalis]
MFIFWKYTVISALYVLSAHAYVEPVTPTSNNALDLNLYEEVIDLEECDRQVAYIVANTGLMIRFIDASFRFPPRSILKGNTRDTGNYFQCLDIKHQTEDMEIIGKYSVVQIPLQQDFEWPSLPELPSLPDLPEITWPIIPNPNATYFNDEQLLGLNIYERARQGAQLMLGSDTLRSEESESVSPLAGMQFELAFCIPKVCPMKYALDVLTSNATASLVVNEAFVRLSNDKTWVAADYVAVVLFSIVGCITVLSTMYDIRHTIILKRDPKKANKMCTTFSLYTNTNNFFIFPSNPNAITCLDGIRSFAMMWVIVGHTFVTQLSYIPENPLDIVEFIRSFWNLWITSATITVDTFFMISGLLVVYTTAAKVSRMSLIRKLHLFYLHRLLRMWPILAAMVLIQASFLHRTTDGPYWDVVAKNVNDCRVYWWSTLLFVQNWVNPMNMCLSHTWYLAIDMQLHVASPLVLFWILGQRSRIAWSALIAALAVALSGTTAYNFVNNFQSAVVSLARTPEDQQQFLMYYYVQTLNRISPFIIGLMIGYILHLYRGKTVRMHWLFAILGWLIAFVASFLVMFATYFNIQPDWDNQLADNFINSSIRPVWAACIAWMVFACHHGYGGPINWLLSIHVFKILGRLSYAMYIIHYQLIFLINATTLQPIYFAVNLSMYRFLIDFSLAAIGAFLLTITIDFPCSNMIKMLLGGGPRPPPKEVPTIPKEPEMAFKAVSVVENSYPDDDLKKTRI